MGSLLRSGPPLEQKLFCPIVVVGVVAVVVIIVVVVDVDKVRSQIKTAKSNMPGLNK